MGIQEYLDYSEKIGDRKALYRLVAKEYGIRTALYPGSHIDIAPSLGIPDVTYVDSFSGTERFFRNREEICAYIEENKEYREASRVSFFASDYGETLPIEEVDLVISQYAGFVSSVAKAYLRDQGILLCNDSHGDATLAFLDKEYALIGVVDESHVIDTKHLERYFQFARPREIDEEKVLATMKGPKYRHRAANYLFSYHPDKA